MEHHTIHPDSWIFTASLQEHPCILMFGVKATSDEHPLTITDRSLYSMSCQSQSFFDHRIDQGAIKGVRYSLTFRSLDWKNKNSTVIIGSSNTCLLKFGTDKRSTFGELMPGKQVYTPLIENIDPRTSCAYQHIVVMCGINDVRQPDVIGPDAVESIYCRLKVKIDQIRALNKTANIYICPLLPTKLSDVNKKVICFNRLINHDLTSSSLGVAFVDGFDGFLDHSGLLAKELSKTLDKHGNPDKLHLNWKGAAMLAGVIKSTVFHRVNGGVDRRPKRTRGVNEESYSSVARRGISAGTRRLR